MLCIVVATHTLAPGSGAMAITGTGYYSDLCGAGSLIYGEFASIQSTFDTAVTSGFSIGQNLGCVSQATAGMAGAAFTATGVEVIKPSCNAGDFYTMPISVYKQMLSLGSSSKIPDPIYNYSEASAMWAFAFISVLMHWFLGKKVGLVLNAIRRF